MRGGANFSVGIKYKPKPEMIGLEPHINYINKMFKIKDLLVHRDNYSGIMNRK